MDGDNEGCPGPKGHCGRKIDRSLEHADFFPSRCFPVPTMPAHSSVDFGQPSQFTTPRLGDRCAVARRPHKFSISVAIQYEITDCDVYKSVSRNSSIVSA